jgi:malate dehydrogenase (quinone)
MIPSFGTRLTDSPATARKVLKSTTKALHLAS